MHGGSALYDVTTTITETVEAHLNEMADYSYIQLLPYAALSTLAVLQQNILPRAVSLPLTYIQYASRIYIWWDLTSSTGMGEVLKGYCSLLREYVGALGNVESGLLGREAHFEMTEIKAQCTILVAQMEAFLSEASDYGGWLWILLWAIVMLFMILVSVSHYRAAAARRHLSGDRAALFDLATGAGREIYTDLDDSDWDESESDESSLDENESDESESDESESDSDDEGYGTSDED
jgi:hypothetical protein